MILKFKKYLLTFCHCCHTVVVTVVVAMIIILIVNVITVAVVFQGMLVPSFQVWNGHIESLFWQPVTIMISIMAMSRTVFGSKISLKKPLRLVFLAYCLYQDQRMHQYWCVLFISKDSLLLTDDWKECFPSNIKKSLIWFHFLLLGFWFSEQKWKK